MRQSKIIKSKLVASIILASAYFIFSFSFFTSINGAIAQGQLKEGAQNIPRKTYEIRPGVVIDRASSSVFIMHPETGIQSVDLETGDTKWATRGADKPLLVSGNILLAQIATETARLDLAILDIAGNGAVIDRISVELPQGIIASINDGAGRSFEVRAVELESKVYLRWTEYRREVAAVERLQKDMVVQSGFGRVNLNERTFVGGSEKIDQRIFQRLSPDLAGNERIREVEATQFRSADQRYAMTSEPVADNRVWEKYEWSIWHRDTGKLVGRIRDFQRYSPFTVVSSILIQEVAPHAQRQDGQIIAVPMSVRAVDLDKGQEIWRHSVRDTAYVGPLPH